MTLSAAEVRQHLIDALQLDLIGPTPDDIAHTEELLPQSPSKWYLSGFLVPYEASPEQRSDATYNEELDQIASSSPGDDETTPEAASARKAYFPSSMGVSVLVSQDTHELDITVEWGDYFPVDIETDEPPAETEPETALSRNQNWQRTPHRVQLQVSLDRATHSSHFTQTLEVPDSNGLKLVISSRPVSQESVPMGTRSVAVFLVNHRPGVSETDKDTAYIFQSLLTLHSIKPFVARPNPRGQTGEDWDESVADLQYRDAMEYVVGHNVSATAILNPEGVCHHVQTAWIPVAEVEKVIPTAIPDVELSMEAIAAFTTAASVREAIAPIVAAYITWIEQQRTIILANAHRQGVANDLLKRAQIASDRIAAGLESLEEPDVFEAFRIANRAIATAIRQRATHNSDQDPEELKPPKWRPFQLAFLLMNLTGIANPTHGDRDIVDLLFFPTGGGKTEAYLGLAAFTLVLRRLRNPEMTGAGVSVLMRYTLRLLTLDQLGRAATLICALELERQTCPEKLGDWPFEIGLWVGQSATPNRMGGKGDNNPNSARSRTIAYQNDSKNKPSPIPLEACPWCGEKFDKNSFQLFPHPDEPTELRVLCGNRKKRLNGQPSCVFRRKNNLPLVAIDDSLYRRLPCFIIATVDKFANLPWVGETGALFGKVDRYDDEGFYGATTPGRGKALEKPLHPPDLIIQDELHLISGPLGTMVGLYETAIDALCTTEENGHLIKPKIIASTATVRRASKQIRALFGRTEVEVFPPPGCDHRDSFFAKTVPPTEKNPRTYIGIAAQCRSLKVVLLRTYLALLSVAEKYWQAQGGKKNPDNPADPYMTLLGYFNSLRELGGSRRIVEDEVTSRLSNYSQRQRVNDPESLFSNRKIENEPSELTSRVNTSEVANTKRRLALPFHEKDRVDVALATNMISVGLDITRLGLMVVLGQPKTAAEYIQATSRVGRDEDRPGLVVTLLNIHRPRDRSHYERLGAWHATFYRAVEATSVTPFSSRAVDRAIAAITVTLARHGHPNLTPATGAAEIIRYREVLDFVADIVGDRAELHDKDLDAQQSEILRRKLKARVKDLLDAWQHIAEDKGILQYQQEVGSAPPLLFDPLDPELLNQPKASQKFKAQRSLRDVEPTVNLWLVNPNGYPEEG